MKVEGEYIAVNELYGSIDGHRTSIAKSLMYNNRKARHAVLGGVVVYDHWITTLEAFGFTATASGGNVKDLIGVSSYGTDFKGVKHDMDVTFEPSVIPANSSTSSITHDVEVKQTKTGKKLTVTCTQAAASVTWTIEATLSVGTAPARGGWVQARVSWTRYKNGSYYDSGTAYPTSMSGYASVSGSYASGDEVYVPSAGTTYYSSSRTAYTVTSFTFTANGESHTMSTNKTVYQSANTYTTSTQYYVSVGSPSVSTIGTTGGTFSFTATCKSKTTYTYTSGSVEYGSETNANAKVTYSNGVSSVSASSFNGSATITANVGENISAQRSPEVTVTASGDSSVYESVQVTQSEVVYILEAGEDKECDGDATTANVSFVSTRNGKLYYIDITSDVSWADVSTVSTSGTKYNAVVDIDANPNASTRDAVITAKQSRWNGEKTVFLTITQAGKAVARPSFGVMIDECVYTDGVLSSVSYSIRFTAYPSSQYNGGTESNVRVELNTEKDGTGERIDYKNIASSLTVNQGSTSKTYSGTLNSNGRFCYFLVYWGNKLQYATEIEENTDFDDGM